MKNEARDAVANLRESIDRLVLRLGLNLEAITKIVDEMDKQIDILEAIDDNDIMEHAYNDLKQITPEDC